MKRPPVDKGEPGKFYFPRGEFIEVKGKKDPPFTMAPQQTTSTKDSPEMCRLRSSREVQGYTPPLPIDYFCSRFPKPYDITLYFKEFSQQGYGEGAIVTRRWSPKDWYKSRYRWGMIILCHKQGHPAAPWNPYTVKWLHGGEIEPAWGEDLIVIHPSLDDAVIEDILESYDVER